MNGNCICFTCGAHGERGLDVVLYRVNDEVVPWCDDCAAIMEDGGCVLERLADQSGEAA